MTITQHRPPSLPGVLTPAIPSPFLQGLLAHPAINLQMDHFLLQRADFTFLRSTVFKYSQMTSQNQSEI